MANVYFIINKNIPDCPMMSLAFRLLLFLLWTFPLSFWLHGHSRLKSHGFHQMRLMLMVVILLNKHFPLYNLRNNIVNHFSIFLNFIIINIKIFSIVTYQFFLTLRRITLTSRVENSFSFTTVWIDGYTDIPISSLLSLGKVRSSSPGTVRMCTKSSAFKCFEHTQLSFAGSHLARLRLTNSTQHCRLFTASDLESA